MLASEDGLRRFPGALGQYVWRFDRPEDLSLALVRLTQCHPHNFAVQMDHRAPAIWGSEMAMECIEDDQRQRYLLRQHNDDPYVAVEILLFGLLKDWFAKHTATRRRDMPSNIALDLRRSLQRMGATICRAKAPGPDA